MPADVARRGLVAFVLTAIGILAALLAGSRGSSALGLQATWSISGRLDASAFRAGSQLAAGGQGFEVISFGAAGPTAALSTYRYGGPDLAPIPQRRFVTCAASASAGRLTLNIGNAFPYAGCVFFPTVTNTGTSAIEVDLGSLQQPAGVFCGRSTCKVDIVAGGTDEAGVADRCISTGSVARASTSLLTYRLASGASMTCPVFVVLLQPASEATTYAVTVDAPRPQAPAPTTYIDVGPAPPLVPGAAATPRPPRTGFGLVVGPAETQPGDGTAILAVVSFLALLGAVLIFSLPKRRRDEDPAELASGEA
ncbi:MAG: hypothetical protein K1X87_05465 [Dehalococcoidia bacterium]|nr:hypothetical protein [Dehalococcoidia bacterium]